MNRTILHSDCNCFYASVELLHHPELRGKPVAVGGDPEVRHGIVLTADYTAKRRGVKTGMALWQARQVCPDIIFLPPRMDLYLRFSRMAQEIYAEYTDKREPYGIDESWLDVTDSVSLKGDGYHIAQEIRSRMKKELGITVSVGVSFNKIFAKLGSDYKKPDAITTMNKDECRDKAWPLPVSDLLYVGSATNNKLRGIGIRAIGDLARTEESLLVRKLGKMGSILWAFANGYDESPVKLENTSAPIKSVGNSTTTPKDMETDEDVKIVLYILAESVAARLRENGFRCRTVEISIRDKDLLHFSKQVKLQNASNITREIAEAGYKLYKESYRMPADEHELKNSRPEFYQKPLRSIGIRGTDLVTDYFWEQLDMFMDPQAREKQMKVDAAVDNIRKRFGFYSIQRGLMYQDRILSACDAKSDHTVHPHGYFG
jgi:DNA polymerase-4